MNLRKYIKERISSKLNEAGSRLTMRDIESMVEKNNKEYGTVFQVSGAYGYVELWANGSRLDAGTPKDIRDTFIKVRFQEKYRDPNWVKPEEQPHPGTGTPEQQSANLKAIGGAFGFDMKEQTESTDHSWTKELIGKEYTSFGYAPYGEGWSEGVIQNITKRIKYSGYEVELLTKEGKKEILTFDENEIKSLISTGKYNYESLFSGEGKKSWVTSSVEKSLNEIESTDYLEDAKKGMEWFNQQAAIEFPNKFVNAKAQSFMGVETSSIVVTFADLTPEEASERLKFMNSPNIRFMMHLTNSFGKQVPMDKFTFEILNMNHKLTDKAEKLGKPFKYRKITGKTPSEALQKMMAWMVANKFVMI